MHGWLVCSHADGAVSLRAARTYGSPRLDKDWQEGMVMAGLTRGHAVRQFRRDGTTTVWCCRRADSAISRARRVPARQDAGFG